MHLQFNFAKGKVYEQQGENISVVGLLIVDVEFIMLICMEMMISVSWPYCSKASILLCASEYTYILCKQYFYRICYTNSLLK